MRDEYDSFEDLRDDLALDMGPEEPEGESSQTILSIGVIIRLLKQKGVIVEENVYPLTPEHVAELKRLWRENHNVVHSREVDTSSHRECWAIIDDLPPKERPAARRSLILQIEALKAAEESWLKTVKGLRPWKEIDSDHVHDSRPSMLDREIAKLENDPNRIVAVQSFSPHSRGKQEISIMSPVSAGLVVSPEEARLAQREYTLNLQRELSGRDWDVVPVAYEDHKFFHDRGCPDGGACQGHKILKNWTYRDTGEAEEFDFSNEPVDLSPQVIVRKVKSWNPERGFETTYQKDGKFWVHPKSGESIMENLFRVKTNIVDILNRAAQGLEMRWADDAFALAVDHNLSERAREAGLSDKPLAYPIRTYPHKRRKTTAKNDEVNLEGLEVRDYGCYFCSKEEKQGLSPCFRDTFDAAKVQPADAFSLRGNTGHWACIAHGSFVRDRTIILSIETKISGRENASLWTVEAECFGEGWLSKFLRTAVTVKGWEHLSRAHQVKRKLQKTGQLFDLRDYRYLIGSDYQYNRRWGQA